MMLFKILTVMVVAFLSACSSSVDDVSGYNEKLFAYEKKLNECNRLETTGIEGEKISGVSEDAIRVGLTYFYIKNSLDCTAKEADALASSVEALIDGQIAAEYIKINARSLKESISFQSKQLLEPENRFNALSDNEKKVLNKISISNRPFSPSAALEYYIDK